MGVSIPKEEVKYHKNLFKYSNRKEYTVNPDVVEYDEKKIAKPMFGLILGVETVREHRIVLDF